MTRAQSATETGTGFDEYRTKSVAPQALLQLVARPTLDLEAAEHEPPLGSQCCHTASRSSAPWNLRRRLQGGALCRTRARPPQRSIGRGSSPSFHTGPLCLDQILCPTELRLPRGDPPARFARDCNPPRSTGRAISQPPLNPAPLTKMPALSIRPCRSAGQTKGFEFPNMTCRLRSVCNLHCFECVGRGRGGDSTG